MWVGGKRFRGEAVEADKARQTYEDIVRRLEDPGLLEYVGRDLWKMRIYPVPRRGEQKIEIRFTSILPREGDLISYRYPLRTGQSPRKTIGDFTMTVRLRCATNRWARSTAPATRSPSTGRKAARRSRASSGAPSRLDRDFCVLCIFAPRGRPPRVLAHGPGLRLARREGYFLLLLERASGPGMAVVPRDIVFVLAASASMDGEKIRREPGGPWSSGFGSLEYRRPVRLIPIRHITDDLSRRPS